jgi:hypothetical protein
MEFLKKLKLDHSWAYTRRNVSQDMVRVTWTPVFTAKLFTIAKLWKQLRSPMNDQWIKKMGYRHTMEYYLAIKKNVIMLFVDKWMELEMLSEVSQTRKDKLHVFPHMVKLNL